MKLIIAEKPSVGRDISTVVGAIDKRQGYKEGNGYLVSWCFGHLLDAAAPEYYDPALKKWSLDTLPILPHPIQIVVLKKTEKQFQLLKSLMERPDVDSLICATDAGREGENIFRLVYQAAGCKKPWQRLWTSSLEPDAIRAALKNMRDGHCYDHLAEAAWCRQVADWLFGINLTRLYTCLYKTKLNTGRVQSPTLAMIVSRQAAIDSFHPTPYWIVKCQLENRFVLEARFEHQEDADAFLSSQPGIGVITQVKNEMKEVPPPKLYDLSALQQEANKLFGYSAAETLANMQVLYEAHLATYPRTDSRYITADMESSVKQLAETFQASGLLPVSDNALDFHRLVNGKKVNDHPALLPTAELTQEKLAGLPQDQKRLMLLLIYRLLEAVSPTCQYYTSSVEATINDITFCASVSVPWETGWKQWRDQCLKRTGAVQEKQGEKTTSCNLTGLEEGMKLSVTGISQERRQTKPPRPYTEATLLSAMETAGRSVEDDSLREAMRGKGLGTAATRAAIIESLVKNGYVVRDAKKLIPTEKAKTFMAVLLDRMKDPVMTAEWEVKLLAIEQGRGAPDQFISEVEVFLGDYIRGMKQFYRPELYEGVFTPAVRGSRPIVGKCPLCGMDVIEHPKSFACSGYRVNGCGFAIWKKIAGKAIRQSTAKQLLESGRTGILKGFQKKDGTEFSSALILRKDGTVGFDRKW